MLLLLLAMDGVAVAPPELRNGSSVITTDDFPKQMIRDGRSAFEDVRIVVAPNGKPDSCTVTDEVTGVHDIRGGADIQAYTCALMMRRALYKPAIGADGLPAYGVSASWTTWLVGRALNDERPHHTDIDIEVASLPNDVPDLAYVNVDVAVAADGTITRCAASPKQRDHSKATVLSPPLADAACGQLIKGGKHLVTRSSGGDAVPYVQRMVARFTTSGGDGSRLR